MRDGQLIERHYTRGSLEQRILEAVESGGDLSLVDEFHVGGRQATAQFGARLQFTAGSELLDIGSGLGGPSRYFALEHGCRVMGIDITEEYVRTAAMLSERLGLSGRVG